MTLWTHDLKIVRLPAIRASMPPSVFSTMRSVFVVFEDPYAVEVRIASVEGSSFSGTRRWMICPSCDAKTIVLGYEPAWQRVGCRRCLRWRTRGTNARAPHVRAPPQVVP